MISASYELEEETVSLAVGGNNDEESIYLSSSSDDENNPKRAVKQRAKKVPMLNGGEYEEDEETDSEDDVMMNGEMVRVAGGSAVVYDDNLHQVSGEEEEEEDDEYEEYDENLPSSYKYSSSYVDNDDHLEDVSDDDEHGSKSATKPTQMFDEYDPENIDNFDESRDILRKYQAQKAKQVLSKVNDEKENEENENESDDESNVAAAAAKEKPEEKEKSVEEKRDARPRRNLVKTQKYIELVESKTKRKYKTRGEKLNEKLDESLTKKKAKLEQIKPDKIKTILESKKVNERQKKSKELSEISSDSLVSISPSTSPPQHPLPQPPLPLLPPTTTTTTENATIKTRSRNKKLNETSENKKRPNQLSPKSNNQTPPPYIPSQITPPPPPPAPSNVISGRIINLSSGFKIPKRPSYESPTNNVPPEKKAKTTEEESDNTITQSPVVNPAPAETPIKKEAPTRSLPLNPATTSAKPTSSSTSPISPTTPKTDKKPKPTSTAPTPNNTQNVPKSKLEKKSSNPPTTTTTTTTQSAKTTKSIKPVKNEFQESDFFMEALGNIRPSKPKAKPIVKEQLNKNSKNSAASDASALTQQSAPGENKTESTYSDTVVNKTTEETLGAGCVQQPQLAQYEANIEQTNILANINNRLNVIDPTLLNNTSIATTTTTTLTSVTSNVELVRVNSVTGVKSNLSEPGLRKAVKKKVTWADGSSISSPRQLENVCYFYLDELERDLKKSAFKGGDMAKIEKLNEKELRFKTGHANNNNMHEFSPSMLHSSEEMPWPTLIPIDLPDTTIQVEVKSVEKEIQQKREQNTLAVLMFKQFLPDSPTEPTELDSTAANTTNKAVQTKLIPLEDVSLLNNSMSDLDTSDNKDTAYNSWERHRKFSNRSRFDENNANKRDNSYQNYGNFNKKQQSTSYQPLLSISATLNTPATVVPTSSPPPPPQVIINNEPNLAPLPTTDTNNLISLSSRVLSSDEMTEKIKKILNRIHATTPIPEPPQLQQSQPVELTNLPNKQENAVSINATSNQSPASPTQFNNLNSLNPSTSIPLDNNEASYQDNNDTNNSDYRKGSKWSSQWPRQQQQQQQQNNAQKPGFFRNSTSSNTNNHNNNNNNNRNSFSNNNNSNNDRNFRRGGRNNDGYRSYEYGNNNHRFDNNNNNNKNSRFNNDKSGFGGNNRSAGYVNSKSSSFGRNRFGNNDVNYDSDSNSRDASLKPQENPTTTTNSATSIQAQGRWI